MGDYSDMFPNENLVKLFLNTLIDGMIINHMQLCAAFVNFILENPSHPQSKCLQEMYGDQFEAIRTFSHAVEDNRVQSSGFSRGLRNAVAKLKETCGVVIVWRSKKRRTKETRGLYVYAIRSTLKSEKYILEFENVHYLRYKTIILS
jgi:hypothetical protein